MTKSSEFNWSKTRAQCPYCEGWYTRQGIQGHVRFRHPDRQELEKEKGKLIKTVYSDLYLKIAEEYYKTKRLNPEMREQIMDMMLLDFIGKKAEGKG